MIKLPSEFTLWKIAAVGFGLIVGIAIISFMNQLNFMFYPKPESFSGSNELYLIELSQNPLFLTGKIISIFAGTFFAGALAGFVNRHVTAKNVIAGGIILLAVGFIDLTAAPYPFWFWILSIVIYIPAVIAGFYFSQKFSYSNEV